MALGIGGAGSASASKSAAPLNYNAVLTSMAWVNIASIGAGAQVWVHTDASANSDQWGCTGGNLFVGSTKAGIDFLETFDLQVSGTNPISSLVGAWHHVTLVRYDHVTLWLFIDGGLHIGMGADMGTSRAASVSDIYPGTPGQLNATVQNIKQWDAALTSDEILREMLTARPARFANLNCWIPTLPGAGLRTRDYSGYGRDFADTSLTDQNGTGLSWGAQTVGPLALATRPAFQRNAFQAGAFQVATTTLNKSLTGITIAPSMSVARHQTEPRHPTLTVSPSPSLVRHQTEPRHPSLSVSPNETLVRSKTAPRAPSLSRSVTAALSRAGSTYRRALALQSYRQAVLAGSPLAYWRLGESSGTSAADASGNGHTATYHGSPTLGVTGALAGDSDTAVTFASASSQYADVALDLSGTNKVTFEFWLNFTGASSQAVISHGDSTATSSILIVATTTPTFAVTVIGASDTDRALLPLSSGMHFYTLVIDRSQVGGPARIKGYVDGALVTTTTVTTGTSAGNFLNDTAILMARKSPSLSLYADGTLDEVAVYTTPLSAATILRHYQIGIGTALFGSVTLARAQTSPRHPTLSISPSETLARVGTFRRAESLSINPGPLVVRSGSIFRRAVSLSISPALSLARRVTFPRATSFSISPAPVVARLGTWHRSLSGVVSVSPTLARAAIHRRAAALSVAVSPTLTRRGAFLRSLALAIAPSLTVSRAKTAPRTLTLTVGIAPSLTRRGVWQRAASLSVDITPSVARHTTFRRALHASVSVSVSVARQGTFRRLLSFSVAPAETLAASVTHMGAITRDLVLSISPAPIVQRIAIHARSQSATVAPTASVSRRLTSRRALSFARAAAATLRRTATFRRAEAFTQSPSPTVQAATSHRRALSFATSPSPSVVRRQVLGRVLRVTRSVAAQVRRTGIWRRAEALSVPIAANVTSQRQHSVQTTFSIPVTPSISRALTASRRLMSSVAVSPSLSRVGSVFRRGVSTIIGWANRLIGFRYPYVKPPTIGVLVSDGQTTGLLSADGRTVGVLPATGETTAELIVTGRTTGILSTAGISGTVFNPRLMAGVYVHGIQRAWNPGLLHAVNEIVQFVGVFQVVRDLDIPVSTDSSTPVTLLRDGLLSLYLTADVPVTLTFQTSGSLTLGTLVLGAEVPYAWTVDDDPLVSPCIITGDVATIHTNSAEEGTLRVRALMNG